jgi:hypothetical protein
MASTTPAEPSPAADPHDATVRALLRFVDLNVGRNWSEEEWREAVRGLGEHLNTHDGFVHCDSSKLWELLGRLVKQYDKSHSAPLKNSRTRSGLLLKGSVGIKASCLEKIGFIRDDADELTMVGHYDDSSNIKNVLDRVVAKSVLTTAVPCE